MRLNLLAFLMFVAVGLSLAHDARAQALPKTTPPTTDVDVVPGTGCAIDYWNVLTWRGWMEGKHDMEAAQTIIGKPVSVLEISCFDQHLTSLQQAADEIFSDRTEIALGVNPPDRPAIENPLFLCRECGEDVPPLETSMCVTPLDEDCDCEPVFTYPCGPDPPGEVMDNFGLDKVLDFAVRAGMAYYLQNFPRPEPYTCPDAPPSPADVCDTMNGLWNGARMHDVDKELYWTFEYMVENEPRSAAAYAGSCGFAPGTPRLRWDLAVNGGDSPDGYIAGAFPPPSNPPTPGPEHAGGMDSLQTFLGSIAPPSLPPTCDQRPIPTGLRFDLRDSQGTIIGTYDDAICAQPGCHYNPRNTPPRCETDFAASPMPLLP